jgi:hypothetical protein
MGARLGHSGRISGQLVTAGQIRRPLFYGDGAGRVSVRVEQYARWNLVAFEAFGQISKNPRYFISWRVIECRVLRFDCNRDSFHFRLPMALDYGRQPRQAGGHIRSGIESAALGDNMRHGFPRIGYFAALAIASNDARKGPPRADDAGAGAV